MLSSSGHSSKPSLAVRSVSAFLKSASVTSPHRHRLVVRSKNPLASTAAVIRLAPAFCVHNLSNTTQSASRGTLVSSITSTAFSRRDWCRGRHSNLVLQNHMFKEKQFFASFKTPLIDLPISRSVGVLDANRKQIQIDMNSGLALTMTMQRLARTSH